MHILAGRFRHFPLQSPKGVAVRPTSSQLRGALFNICQNQIEGATFLDLFAGSGAMGLEALSRGCKHITLVEHDRLAIQCIRANIAKLKAEPNVTLLQSDAMAALTHLKKKKAQFTIIYIDPPYGALGTWEGKRLSLAHQALYILDQSDLLVADGLVFVETSKESLPENLKLSHLIFKNSRRYGSTYLSQFHYQKESLL